MKKLLMTGVATVFVMTLAAAPASAGGTVYFGFGGGHGWGHHGYDIDNDVYIDVSPSYDDDDYEDDEYDEAHYDWCEEHYQTYDRETNLYYYAPGKQRECNPY